MIVSVSPDKQGFADAQRRLREKLGMDVTFWMPPTTTFDPDVDLDPETGEPYDPMIAASASVQASAAVRCSVVQRPFALPATHGVDTAEGWGSETDVSLIMDAAAASAVASAVAFEYADNLFSIRTAMFDGIGDIQRFVVHGARQS